MEPVFACAFVADVADDAAPDPSVTISAMTAHGELSTAVPLPAGEEQIDVTKSARACSYYAARRYRHSIFNILVVQI